MNSNEISDELSKFSAGYLPEELFAQIARLGVLASIEIVALREYGDKIEVCLTRRENTDKFWPNKYHNPGTVFRPNDTIHSLQDQINRIYTEEYKLAHSPTGPFFSGLFFDKLERGTALGIICWIELQDSEVGEYFSVDNLPENIIKNQISYIKKCAEDYRNYKCGNFNPTPIDQLIIQ